MTNSVMSRDNIFDCFFVNIYFKLHKITNVMHITGEYIYLKCWSQQAILQSERLEH